MSLFLYRTVQGGQLAVGSVGIRSRFTNIKNHDLSKTVADHSGYFAPSIRLK
jgi:hypothetical protein